MTVDAGSANRRVNNEPTLGVVVPVYGEVALVIDCLESLVRQTRTFDRVTIVDDCCGDPVMTNMLESYVSENRGWQLLVNDEPQGIVASSNRGAEVTESEYICFLDCDDLLASRAASVLTEQLPLIGQPFVSTRYATFNNYSDKPLDLGLPELRSVFPSDLHLILEHLFLSHLKVVRRDWFIQRQGFPAGTDGVQDWCLALDAVAASQYALLDEVLYFHRIHPGQTSGTARARFMSIVNARRSGLLRERFARRALDSQEELQVRAVCDGLIRTLASESIPAFCVVGTVSGIHAIPASAPLIDCFVAERDVRWLLLFGDTWFDIGQLSGAAGDRAYSLGVLVSRGCPRSAEIARWYAGYLDFAVISDSAQGMALSESWPPGLDVMNLNWQLSDA
jgi:glycosyltransferase involved in cell wall biosynthesis